VGTSITDYLISSSFGKRKIFREPLSQQTGFCAENRKSGLTERGIFLLSYKNYIIMRDLQKKHESVTKWSRKKRRRKTVFLKQKSVPKISVL
jgi:hypothetical protein